MSSKAVWLYSKILSEPQYIIYRKKKCCFCFRKRRTRRVPMKKNNKYKLLIVFAVICSILNVQGIESKYAQPEPVIELTENELDNKNILNNSETHKSDTEHTVEEELVVSYKNEEKLSIPLSTKAGLTEDKVDIDSGDSDDEFMPGEILVCFKNECSDSSISDIISKQKVVKTKDIYKSIYKSAKQDSSIDTSKLKSLKKEIGKNYLITISGKSKKDVLKTIEELKKEPNVKYAEPNYICKPCYEPNDYNNFDLWNMDRIQMPETWNSTPGVKINVGVLDSGIDYRHPDIKNNVNTSLGWNCALKSNTDTLDYYHHGTHVAGIIGAEGNNSIGIVGVNPLVRLVPIKICISNTDHKSNTELITEGIIHATKNNIPICNLSYGLPSSSIFRDAVKKYGQNGGTLIVAAGNNGICVDDKEHYKLFSELNNVILVANSNKNEVLSSSSNYGNVIHVAAPGSNILSTVPTSYSASGYQYLSGTSMAAPHVTGVVSLLKGKNPDISPVDIRHVLMERVDYVPKLDGKVLSKGRINAKNTVVGFLSVIPNSNETIADSIKRSLGSRSGADIEFLKLKGVTGLLDGTGSSDSASAILPNLQYADISEYIGDLKRFLFYGCENLTTVVLPMDNVKLPSYCFMKCKKLSTIYRRNGDRKLNEADFTGLISSSTGQFAAQTQCFEGCSALKTIKLPNTTKLRFSRSVFKGCTNLATVYINTQVPVIGEADLTEFTELYQNVFNGTGITSVKLPEDVKIQASAFENCNKLKSIQVHPKQTELFIDNNAFYNVNEECKIFMNQILYKKTSNIPRTATQNISKEINSLIIMPKTNEKIGDTIKYYLTESSLNASLIKNLVISGNAVMGDSDSSNSASILPNLSCIDMSSFTGSVGNYAFKSCNNLECVIRNSNFSSIPGQCFKSCRKLTTILKSDQYPKIWNEADLSDITGNLAIDTEAFEGCIKLTTVKLPSESIGIAGAFPNCTNLSTIYRDGDEKQIGTFDLTGVTNLWVGWGHNFKNTSVSILKLCKGVGIPDYCFYNCSELKKILFERIQIYTISIGSYAFYGVNSECKAYMDSMLVYNDEFQIKRSSTDNITKIAY